MNVRFDPRGYLIIIPARLYRRNSTKTARLALDTGATRTVVSREIALSLGYSISTSAEGAQILTGGGALTVPMMTVEKIEALGKEATNLPVLCHTLPSRAAVDGVLGLDFLRGGRLTIDFRAGLLELD